MNRRDVFVLGMSWLLINLMAGYGAAKLFGDAVWIYVVFICMYMYYCDSINKRDRK